MYWCTFQMDVVLEKAHQVVEGNTHNIPSSDELIEKPLIFKTSDVVMMTAMNVDLEYATRGKYCFQETSLQPAVKTSS